MKHKIYYPVPGGHGECENCGKQNPDLDEDCEVMKMYQFWSRGKLWCKGDESKVDKYGRSHCIICGRKFGRDEYSYVHEAARYVG